MIAGELHGTRGPAATFTAVHVWDVSVTEGKAAELPIPGGFTTLLVPIRGQVRLPRRLGGHLCRP